MSKWVRRSVVLLWISALLPVIAGVAEAAPVQQEKITAAGYHIKVSIEGVTVQSVPNMAAAPLVREGFITATSRLEVTCNQDPPGTKPVDSTCAKSPLMMRSLNMFAQVGCPLDLSSGTKVGLAPAFTSSLPVGNILGAILPPAPAPGPSDLTDIGFTPTGQVTPQVTLTLFPGFIRDVPLADVVFPDSRTIDEIKKDLTLAGNAKKLQGTGSAVDTTLTARLTARAVAALTDPLGQKPLELSVRNFHLEVDNKDNALGVCGGAVAARIYAQAQIQTPESVDTVDIYGDVFTL